MFIFTNTKKQAKFKNISWQYIDIYLNNQCWIKNEMECEAFFWTGMS